LDGSESSRPRRRESTGGYERHNGDLLRFFVFASFTALAVKGAGGSAEPRHLEEQRFPGWSGWSISGGRSPVLID
jgi:hypothetical protein